jgi:hypothetical protein
MTTRYRVRLLGRLPQSAAETIRGRFGDVGVGGDQRITVLSGTVPDQSALRALLGLIWDTGATVLSLTAAPSPPAIGASDPARASS